MRWNWWQKDLWDFPAVVFSFSRLFLRIVLFIPVLNACWLSMWSCAALTTCLTRSMMSRKQSCESCVNSNLQPVNNTLTTCYSQAHGIQSYSLGVAHHPTRGFSAHTSLPSDGISTGTAIFSQLTHVTNNHYSTVFARWQPRALSCGDLSPRESIFQMASRFMRLFLHG